MNLPILLFSGNDLDSQLRARQESVSSVDVRKIVLLSATLPLSL